MNKICLNMAATLLSDRISCRSLSVLPPPGFISPGEMVEDRRPPVYAFYNYHSVPLPPCNISTMFDYVSPSRRFLLCARRVQVSSRLQQSLDRILIGLDPQRASSDVLQAVRALPNCQLEFFESKETYHVVSSIWQQITRAPSSGTLLLISGVVLPLFRNWYLLQTSQSSSP